MATSAFNSTTKRTPIRGSSSSEDSVGASRSLRRSRSLSRFSRPIHPERETEPPVPDYNKTGPRGKFVNTVRGSAAFPEISLDDLALEFLGSSSRTENESDGVREGKKREGRSIGRWASDTMSSRRRGRSVSRSRAGSISNSSAFEGNKIVSSSSDAGSRRRRSLSVARHQISDSESEVDYARSSRKNSNVKAPSDAKSQMHVASKTTPSSNWRLGRSRSHKDLSVSPDSYSAEHPRKDVPNGGLYEAMRKELRHAVQEIRNELNQAMGRNQEALTSDCLRSDNSKTLPDLSVIRKINATKLEQRSSDRNHMSKRLSEEAERYFEGFISNVDTDISSLDGERSDGSSTLGVKEREAAIYRNGPYSTAGSISSPIEMDGVNLPWLLWETRHDGCLSGKNKTQTPVTPKILHWGSEKDIILNDPSSRSISSQRSWSPGRHSDSLGYKRGDTGNTRKVGDSWFDMEEYCTLPNNEEGLFEMYRQRNRINSGSLLICSTGIGVLY